MVPSSGAKGDMKPIARELPSEHQIRTASPGTPCATTREGGWGRWRSQSCKSEICSWTVGLFQWAEKNPFNMERSEHHETVTQAALVRDILDLRRLRDDPRLRTSQSGDRMDLLRRFDLRERGRLPCPVM